MGRLEVALKTFFLLLDLFVRGLSNFSIGDIAFFRFCLYN